MRKLKITLSAITVVCICFLLTACGGGDMTKALVNYLEEQGNTVVESLELAQISDLVDKAYTINGGARNSDGADFWVMKVPEETNTFTDFLYDSDYFHALADYHNESGTAFSIGGGGMIYGDSFGFRYVCLEIDGSNPFASLFDDFFSNYDNNNATGGGEGKNFFSFLFNPLFAVIFIVIAGLLAWYLLIKRYKVNQGYFNLTVIMLGLYFVLAVLLSILFPKGGGEFIGIQGLFFIALASVGGFFYVRHTIKKEKVVRYPAKDENATKYEYKVEIVKVGRLGMLFDDSGPQMKQLNKAGDGAWELICTSEGSRYLKYIFCRECVPETKVAETAK